MTDETRPVQTMPAGTEPEALAGVLADDGCVVVDSLVAPEVMDAVEREARPFIDATATGRDDFTGFATRRTGALLARSTTFRDLAMDPTVLGTLDRVLGVHATTYQLHLTQIIDIGPGQPAQLVHRDQWAFDFFPFPPDIEVECHVMWAMTDFSERNGATRVIPGSNHWEDKLRPTADQTVPAEMAKGSVLMYVGSLYHGGGANRSDAHRLGVNVGYTLSWLRQEENQYLACPPSVASQLPRELARLAGYRRGAYALGYYGDLQDPIDALTGVAEGEGSVGFAP